MNVIENWLKRKKLQHIFSIKEDEDDDYYPRQSLSMHLAVRTHPIIDWMNCFNVAHICNTFTPKLIDIQRNVIYGNHSMVCVGTTEDFTYIKLMTKAPMFEIEKKDLATDAWKETAQSFINISAHGSAILFVPLTVLHEAASVLEGIYDMCFLATEKHTEKEAYHYRVQFYIDLLNTDITYDTKEMLINHMSVGAKYAVGTTIYMKNPSNMKYASLCYPCKAVVFEKSWEAHFILLQDLVKSIKENTKIENAIQTMPKLHSLVWIRDQGWCTDDM